MIAKPSKRAISFIILAVGIVFFIIIISRSSDTSAKKVSGELMAGQKINIPENPEWQSEFDKINQNISIANYSNSIENAGSSSTDTLTDSVSKSLISNYLSLKQGGSLNNDSAQKLIDQTVNYVDIVGGKTPKTPTIKVILENNTDNIRNYGDLLGAIFKEGSSGERIDERTIITTSIQNNKFEDLKKLEKVVTVYQNTVDNMSVMSVPKGLVQVHTNMITGLNSMIFGLKEIQTVATDPIRALSGLKEYGVGATEFTKALRQTILFLKANGIDYKQGSGGYYLLKGL